MFGGPTEILTLTFGIVISCLQSWIAQPRYHALSFFVFRFIYFRDNTTLMHFSELKYVISCM